MNPFGCKVDEEAKELIVSIEGDLLSSNCQFPIQLLEEKIEARMSQVGPGWTVVVDLGGVGDIDGPGFRALGHLSTLMEERGYRVRGHGQHGVPAETAVLLPVLLGPNVSTALA